MASFASDHSIAEKGPVRCNTIDTIVAEPDILVASGSSPPKSGPGVDNLSSATDAFESPKQPDASKAGRRKDITEFPKGFARLFEQQARVDNGGIHRRFEPEGQEIIGYLEQKLAFQAEGLYQWKLHHPDITKRLSAGQKQQLGKTCELEEYDKMIDELSQTWYKYHKYLRADSKSRNFHSAHRDEVKGLRRFLASQDMTDEDVFLPFYTSANDFLCTAPNQEHLPISDMLYSRVGKWLRRNLSFLRVNEDIGAILVSRRIISLFPDSLRYFFATGSILIPCGVIYLGNLSDVENYGVVVVSVFIFSGVWSWRRQGDIIIGVLAYATVLVSFLGQLRS